MTPEERAMESLREIITVARNKGADEAVKVYLAAIREAVKAERAECATLAEFGEWTPNGDDPYCSIQIAAAIRERPL